MVSGFSIHRALQGCPKRNEPPTGPALRVSTVAPPTSSGSARLQLGGAHESTGLLLKSAVPIDIEPTRGTHMLGAERALQLKRRFSAYFSERPARRPKDGEPRHRTENSIENRRARGIETDCIGPNRQSSVASPLYRRKISTDPVNDRCTAPSPASKQTPQRAASDECVRPRGTVPTPHRHRISTAQVKNSDRSGQPYRKRS